LSNNFGIEKGYPNLRRLWSKLADFFTLCRPFTLLGAWIAGFFLDVLFSKSALNLFHALQVGLSLAFLQAGGQALNQSIQEEVDIDRLNGKLYRPTVSGKLTLKEGKIISVALFTAGIFVALNLSVAYGLFSLLITFFAAAYTTPPFRIKKYFLLNNLWQGISRGFLPTVYVSLNYSNFGLFPLFYGVALAIWVTGAQTSKDFGDEVGDRKFHIHTFPAVLGLDRALQLMSILMLLGFLCMDLFILSNLLPSPFLILNVLLIPSALMVYSLLKQVKLKYAENSLGWVGFYSTLGLFYILPSLLL